MSWGCSPIFRDAQWSANVGKRKLGFWRRLWYRMTEWYYKTGLTYKKIDPYRDYSRARK